MFHLAQLISTNEFREYDKGAEKLDLFGLYEDRMKPNLIPYPLIDGRVPIYIFAGGRDTVSTLEESVWIMSNIKGV